MSLPQSDLPIAVSCGDPAGIGPDIILKAYQKREANGLAPFFVLGDPGQLASRGLAMGLDVALRSIENAAETHGAFVGALPVLPLQNSLNEAPCKPSADNVEGIVEAIERGVNACINGSASALVTAPIAKSVLYESGFAFPGHTEFLADLAGKQTGKPIKPVMMIAGPELRTIPVTIHIPLADVTATLTTDDIVETGRIAAHDLQSRFGIKKPRLAISGLNPHAGENGALGTQDETIIVPAIAQLQNEGIDARGPLPADTMFHKAARLTYDVAICMYHDQALIPAKTLAFDDGVNVTLGLPFIRTSPDHGTAFDIAGTGKAKPDSFIAALKTAEEMASQ